MTLIIVKGSKDRVVKLGRDLVRQHSKHYGINDNKSREIVKDFCEMNDTSGYFKEGNKGEHIQSISADFQKLKEQKQKGGGKIGL